MTQTLSAYNTNTFLQLLFKKTKQKNCSISACVTAYHQNELDETQIQQAGDDVVLPTELAKMIAEDNQEEAHKQSVLGQLSNLQNVDMDQLKDKAQATLEDLKKQTENCSLM